MRLALGLLLIGACSSSSEDADGPRAIDAPPAVDAVALPDAAAAQGPVSVTVRGPDGSPVAGATVVSQLVTGAVLNVGTTGSDGTVIVQAVSGGAVTTGFLEGEVHRLVTVMGVSFGQSVLLQARPPRRDETDDWSLQQIPSNTPDGTVAFLAQVPCRFGGQAVPLNSVPVDVFIPYDCYVGNQYSAALIALDTNGVALGYSFQDGITRLASPVLPGWTTDVTSYNVTFTNGAACTDCGRLDTFRRTATNLQYSAGGAVLSFVAGTDLVVAIPHAPMIVAPETGFILTLSGDDSRSIVRRSTTEAPAPDTVDLGQLLPVITSLVADPTGPRLQVRYTLGAASHAPRAALFEISWRVLDDQQEIQNLEWTVLTPPRADDRLDLPGLPEELGAFAPVLPGDLGDYDAKLTLFDDTAIASFAALAASDWLAEIGGNAPTRPGKRTVTLSSRP